MIRRRRRSLARRDRGAIIPLTAMLLSVLILAVAFAVDLGRQRAERRDMQAIADVVSLDAARYLMGRDAVTLDSAPDFATAVSESTARNDHANPTMPCPDGDIPGPCLTVTVGSWTGGTTPTFTPCAPVGDPARSSCVPDAVEVVAGTEVDYAFQPGSGDTRRTAVSRVGDDQRANFMVGSSLVTINSQTNSLIGQLLDTIVPGASVLGYQGLATATVTLQQLGVPLGIPLTTASPDELLDTEVSLFDLMVATADALEADGGETADIALIEQLISLGVQDVQVNLGELLGVNAGGGPAGATATANVAQLLMTSVFLADTDHFVNIPATTLGIPGLADVGIRLTGVEAPQRGGDTDGASVTTRQIGLEVSPTFAINTASVAQSVCALPPSEQNLVNALLGGILNLLGCTLSIVLPPPSQQLSVQVQGSTTIGVDVAEVTVTQDIDCDNDQLLLNSSPTAVELLADLDLAISATLGTATIPNIAQLSIDAGAVANGNPVTRAFQGINPVTTSTGREYTQFTPSQASANNGTLGLSQLLNASASTLSVARLDLSVLANIVLGIVQPAINATLGTLDTVLLQPLAGLLGLNLGDTMLTPLDMTCEDTAVLLVQ